MRAVTKITQINLNYRGLHSDVPPVRCEVSRALTRRGLAVGLTRRGLAMQARLRTEATLLSIGNRLARAANEPSKSNGLICNVVSDTSEN